MIRAVPLSLTEARTYIDEKHRHHISAKSDKYRLGAEVNGELVGVAQCGRPVSRHLDDGKTIEVLRLCTDGSKNVCSFLYARCARIAQELGYEKIITYILESEMGTSLQASGWYCDQKQTGGGYMEQTIKAKRIRTNAGIFFPIKTKVPDRKETAVGKGLKSIKAR